MTNLEKYYEIKCKTIGDIHEHLPILKHYTELCEHVTEMGVRDVVSTFAFMMGKPKRLVSIDVYEPKLLGEVNKLAQENNIDFKFVLGSTLEITIEETDLLFIDTEHNYLQLKNELERHGNKAKKYLIFHDVMAFGYEDSNAYGDQGLRFKEDEEKRYGLMPAIYGFLERNSHWRIEKFFTNNNGLLICKRV